VIFRNGEVMELDESFLAIMKKGSLKTPFLINLTSFNKFFQRNLSGSVGGKTVFADICRQTFCIQICDPDRGPLEIHFIGIG